MAILEPIVTFTQELIVPVRESMLGAVDDRKLHAEFATRLNEICDERGVPPKYHNRQKVLGDQFGVTQKGARKWLEGESFPTLEKAIKIALWGSVNVEWLLTGRGEKYVAPAKYAPAIATVLTAMQDLKPYQIEQAVRIIKALPDPDRDGDQSSVN